LPNYNKIVVSGSWATKRMAHIAWNAEGVGGKGVGRVRDKYASFANTGVSDSCTFDRG